MATIGIPRALMYYRFFPLWKEIIRQSGNQLILSRTPKKGFIAGGNLPGPGDICLPVKLFLAHVDDLKDRCDALFIPRLISFESKTYNCPHFLGIPDVVRAQCSPEIPVLDPVYNSKTQQQSLFDFIKQTCTLLKCKKFIKRIDINTIKGKYERTLTRFPTRTEPKLFEQIDFKQAKHIIGLVGRPYILYEPELAGRLFHFFDKEKIFIITPEMINNRLKTRALTNLPRPIFWHNSRENAGAAFSLLNNKRIDGLVQIVTFGCGPDSLIKELIDLEASSKQGFPYLSLVLDQQSSHEAVHTRLEAFLDMLKRKKRQKNLS